VIQVHPSKSIHPSPSIQVENHLVEDKSRG
jgi:hypothetical protein